MKQHLLTLLTLLALLALAIAPARGQSETAQTVIVFGDSITAGGALPGNERDAV